MGFVVLHMEKAHGSDSGTTAHIERFIIPKNADPTRTHLNRRLIEYPDGIKDRSAAIQQRLEEAGLTRKIGSNQVRAIRINVSGTHEDMKRIEEEGRLDEWCADNLKYFADTFGKENIVAAHLHRDEETPHIHVTLVPIVKGERKRRKREEQTKKRYRKKPTDTVRLCADDIMTRLKLKSYQDTYAVAMAKYGLQRGIDGSKARHKSTQQYYRDIQKLSDDLKAEVVDLQQQKETAQEELRRAKKEIQTEKLKGAATTAAANIAESVGSLFGSNKVKTLERENTALHKEVADHEETIEALQDRIQTMQADHSREIREMQQKHGREIADKDTRHKQEISFLKTVIARAAAWFPYFRDLSKPLSTSKSKNTMNRILTLYLFLLLCGTASAQQIVKWDDLQTITDNARRTVYYEKGSKQPLQGEYRIIRGLDEERVKLSDGIINGDYLRYRDGVLRESGIYAKGKRNGIFTEYYQDGVTPRKETPMQQGKIDGTVKTYFRNGKIEIEKEYRQSVESGRERRFDSKTGEQIFESHYIDGKKEGEEWEIFEDGRTLRSRTTRHYRNGKLDGFYRVESTRDGKPYITIEGQYTDGEKSGRWKQYNATDDTTHEWDE